MHTVLSAECHSTTPAVTVLSYWCLAGIILGLRVMREICDVWWRIQYWDDSVNKCWSASLLLQPPNLAVITKLTSVDLRAADSKLELHPYMLNYILFHSSHSRQSFAMCLLFLCSLRDDTDNMNYRSATTGMWKFDLSMLLEELKLMLTCKIGEMPNYAWIFASRRRISCVLVLSICFMDALHHLTLVVMVSFFNSKTIDDVEALTKNTWDKDI